MSDTAKPKATRRDFLRTSGQVAAATGLAGLMVPHVHASQSNTIQVVLIGCGGRGTGAAANAMSVKNAPTKLVAMADVYQDKLDASYKNLKRQFGDQIDVPKDRQFIGFDGYRKAMDCLNPGDIAIFTTPLAFRWVHFTYAIEKNLNVFMEKPLTADGPTSRKMLALGKQATAKNLKVGVGLMSRHSRALQALHERITDDIGDIVTMFAYRMTGPVGSAFSTRWPGTPSELLWQIRHFHSFIWASGGCFNDFYIHVVDHCCWMKNAWPVKAQALGGRHYRNNPSGERQVDQNFDSYSVEYTFADGAKLICDGRCVAGAENFYKSYAMGTKGLAVVSKHGDCGPPSSTYTGMLPSKDKQIWESTLPRDQRNPYQNEWNDLIDAILKDQPYSEVDYGVHASLVSSLGRKAAHTGKEITLEQLLNSDQVYAPGVENYTMDSPPPIKADADGLYPIPRPGVITDREY